MQQPNRYFNSPWIADAARNLSMAIAGDPDAERRKAQSEFEMQRMRQQDAIAAKQRQDADIAAASLADIWSAPESEVNARTADALRAHAPVEGATGRARMIQQNEQFGDRLSNALTGIRERLGVSEANSAADRAERARQANQRNDTTLAGIHSREYTEEEKRKLKEKLTRTGKDGKTYAVPIGQGVDIAISLKNIAKNFGGRIEPKLLDEMVGQVSDIIHNTGDGPNASRNVFEQTFGSLPDKTEDTWHMFDDTEPGNLIPIQRASPTPMGASAPSMPGGSLSGVFGQSAAQTPVMLRPPPQAQTPAPPMKNGYPVFNSMEEAQAAGLPRGQVFSQPDGRYFKVR